MALLRMGRGVLGLKSEALVAVELLASNQSVDESRERLAKLRRQLMEIAPRGCPAAVRKSAEVRLICREMLLLDGAIRLGAR